jgi:hypothetical protein
VISLVGERGTLILDIPGYVPVVIRDLVVPQGGLTLDFEPVAIDEAVVGDRIVIDYDEIRTTVISARVELPGHFTGSFAPPSALSSFSTIDTGQWQIEGLPTVFGPADRAAVMAGTVPFLMIMMNKDLSPSGRYLFGMDVIDGGNADLHFSTPRIRDEDTRMPVTFSAVAGTLDLELYSTVPGERIAGTFDVDIEAEKIICHDGACDDYSLESITGRIRGWFNGYLTNVIDEPAAQVVR